MFNFYRRVLPRLQSVLPKPFRLEDNIRREETAAHTAVREALINLCIHADYTENASLVVRHNLNGFVFSNPGTLLVSKNQYYSGGESVCRNKSLQKMFTMLGVAEKAGSGTDKIMKGWKESNWRTPVLEETQRPDKVVLNMPMESLLAVNFDIKGATSDIKGATSDTKVATSDTKVATSDTKVATSDTKVATSLKKKMSKTELYDRIIDICSEWMSMDEIVEKANRSTLYIRNKVIPVMLKEKMLVMLYPGTPNHPNQKYKHTDN